MIARLDELKAQIDALRPIKPEQEQRILQKFRLDWNYHSNAIEGNSLTLGETRAFLLEGLTAKGKSFKDHLDIRGHNQLILFLEDFVRQKEILTEAGIREMHKMLLVEPYQVEARTPDGQVTKKWVTLGEYKTEPNAVQTATGEWIYYARPEDTGPRMAELVAWYRQQTETQAEHPLLVATLFHHRFTHIHPFDDGNGRMARALMNVILMREGFPPAVLKTQNRAEYVAALRKADSGDSGDLAMFVGTSLLRSEELVLRGAKGESVDEPVDLAREVALLKQELQSRRSNAAKTLLEIQNQRFHAKIKPLLIRVLTRIAPISELFDLTNVRIESFHYAERTTSRHTETHGLEAAKASLDAWTIGGFLSEPMGAMVMKVNWSQLKRVGESAPPLSASIGVNIVLEESEFSIGSRDGSTASLRYSYEAPVDYSQLDEMVAAVTRKLIAQVRGEIAKH